MLSSTSWDCETHFKLLIQDKPAETENEKHKINDKKESDAFPSTKRNRDFQYSVFAAEAHTKMIVGFSTTDDHSNSELFHFPYKKSQTYDLCPDAQSKAVKLPESYKPWTCK